MNVAVAFDHRGVHLRDAVLEALATAATRSSTSAPTPTRCGSTIPTRRRSSATRSSTAAPSAASSSAAPASARRSPPARSPASARRSATTSTRAHQGVEHDDMNVLCLGSEVVGPRLARRARRARSSARSSTAASATSSGCRRSKRWKGRWHMAESNLHKLCAARAVGLDRLPLARHARAGRARADDEGGRRRRPHVEPDHLPEGDLAGERVRRAAEGAARATTTDPKEIFLAARRRATSQPRCDAARAGARAERRRTGSSRWRSTRRSPTTARAPSTRRCACTRGSTGRTST